MRAWCDQNHSSAAQTRAGGRPYDGQREGEEGGGGGSSGGLRLAAPLLGSCSAGVCGLRPVSRSVSEQASRARRPPTHAAPVRYPRRVEFVRLSMSSAGARSVEHVGWRCAENAGARSVAVATVCRYAAGSTAPHISRIGKEQGSDTARCGSASEARTHHVGPTVPPQRLAARRSPPIVPRRDPSRANEEPRAQRDPEAVTTDPIRSL